MGWREVHEKVKAREATSADGVLAANARKEGERYQEIYRPLNQELMKELGSNRLLEAANAEVGEILSGAGQTERLQRQAGRQGITLDGATRHKIDRAQSFNNAETAVQTLDTARMAQRDRNDGLRMELINLGRGMATSGTNMLQDAANNETQRNIANANARAQDKAAKKQLLGTAVGMGAMLLLM